MSVPLKNKLPQYVFDFLNDIILLDSLFYIIVNKQLSPMYPLYHIHDKMSSFFVKYTILFCDCKVNVRIALSLRNPPREKQTNTSQ